MIKSLVQVRRAPTLNIHDYIQTYTFQSVIGMSEQAPILKRSSSFVDLHSTMDLTNNAEPGLKGCKQVM